MAKLDLTQYGITGSTVIAHNPSYEFLFEEETKAGLTGFDKGQNTELNAVNVMTGIYTGRSPKDKYIVKDAQSEDKGWWTTEGYKNDNHPMSEEVWAKVKEIAIKELCNKNLYVVDIPVLPDVLINVLSFNDITVAADLSTVITSYSFVQSDALLIISFLISGISPPINRFISPR